MKAAVYYGKHNLVVEDVPVRLDVEVGENVMIMWNGCAHF